MYISTYASLRFGQSDSGAASPGGSVGVSWMNIDCVCVKEGDVWTYKIGCAPCTFDYVCIYRMINRDKY